MNQRKAGAVEARIEDEQGLLSTVSLKLQKNEAKQSDQDIDEA